MDITITKDADALICLIYKHYLELRNNNTPKSQAKMLGSSETIQTKIIPEWSFEDVDETCRELNRANLITVTYADDICYNIILTDAGIIYMENRFSNKLKNVLDYISSIKFW